MIVLYSCLRRLACSLEFESLGQERRVACFSVIFFFQAEDGIRDLTVTGVQTCALPISGAPVLLIGKHSAKLRIAERRGIETTTARQAAKRKREFDVTVEASGVAEGFKIGRASCRERV